MTFDQNVFMNRMVTLASIGIPKWYRVLALMLVAFMVVAGLMLYFVPWQQTAQASGVVSTLNPADRAQPISALVPGQIKRWHVNEGQSVKKGDPLVTLIDTDAGLVEKLNAQLNAADARLQANRLAVENARNNLARQKILLAEGLVSPRDIEAAQISLQERLATVAKTEEDKNTVSMSLARQSTQTKFAPQNGTVTRLQSGGTSTLVKSGDVLAWFVPDGVERMVRVSVGGLDAPLVTPGRKVRLQFEGWPIFQFSGWPGSSVGTFGGEVVAVDPVATHTGQFSAWIKPDSEDKPWPDDSVVRLDSRVKAWILLEEVKLGYELWRQLNNFPPENPNAAAQWGNNGK